MAQIKTYARLKPTKKPYPGYTTSNNVLTIDIPDSKDMANLGTFFQHTIRSNMSYDIVFNNIFLPEASQEQVFDGVAKDIIYNFLNGYNGTIFAYGQTGTGKTYTVEGNSGGYKTRGLATRALSMIYQQLENRADEHISVYLSYLEIYQEVAYDLLNPASRTMLPVIPFAKVTVVEGPRGSCILRGLSLHLAANEEIAQMLLLQGQANRHVAETPVNQRSSRSHSVFSVYLQARKHDSQVILSSKLHVVDLAGSERVSKTGVDGQQLTEAKSINLSLHHLETVIIALQTERGSSAGGGGERGEANLAGSRSSSSFMSSPSSDACTRSSRYVPYRNSLLTMILRDSLGGNCLTAMVATISMEPENLGESISTCRFAQRVARIANYARRNEEVDDKVLIKKLKDKVAQLENQVALLRSKGLPQPETDEDVLDALSDYDRSLCASIMEEYLHDIINDPVSAGIYKVSQFRECLSLLKHRFQESATVAKNSQVRGPTSSNEDSKGLMYNGRLQDGGDHAAKSPKKDKDEFYTGKPTEAPHSAESSHCTLTASSDTSVNILPSQVKGTSPGFESKVSNVGKNKSPIHKHQPSGTPEENGRDQVDHLLVALSKNEGYKSPFERKREKEIKKLGRKLNSMEEQKVMKEEELQVMKQDLVLQSLQMEEDGMRLKLQVSDEQVADQHIYLLQLKHLQADPDLIAREMLVEKQLRKRQLKFREKLDGIVERKEGVERELSQLHQDANQSTTKNKLSFEEKFGQYKQGKGSLNTRQVFAILKNEEKQKKKDVGNMEREKAVIKAKHVELKEIATLEKLRELKQILKMSQKYGKEAENEDREGGQIYQNVDRPSSSGENFITFTDSSMANSNGNKEAVSHNIENQRNEEERLDSRLEFKQAMTRNSSVGTDMPLQGPNAAMANPLALPSSQVNGHHISMDANNVSSHAPNSSWAQYLSQDDDDKLEARSSAISAHSQGKFLAYFPLNSTQPQDKIHLTYSLHSKNSPINIGISDCDTEQDANNSSELFIKPKTIYSENSSQNHQPSSERDVSISNNNERLENDSPGACCGEDVVEDLEMIDPVGRDASTKSDYEPNTLNDSATRVETSQSMMTKTLSNNREVGKDLKLCDMEKLNASDIFDSLKPSSIHLSNSHDVHPSSKTQPVLPPSEYINFMMTNEGFDARRMGLSSRTFESALSHMLDSGESRAKANVPELPYSMDPYEKYVRTSDLCKASHSKHTKKSSKHESSYSSRKDQLMKDLVQREKKAKVEKNPWGPEMKKTSISERLSGFLDSPSDFLPVSDKGNQYESGTNSFPVESLPVEDLEDTLDQPPRVQVDDSLNEDDSFFGQITPRTKIKALRNDEGEKTYMSRVAAEKQRVAKIKKARHAAELIQRNWRKYKRSH